jgi:hypothetical protein
MSQLLAQSGHRRMSEYLSAFGAKRTLIKRAEHCQTASCSQQRPLGTPAYGRKPDIEPPSPE